MLTCREVTELVTDYVEGRMGWWDRIRFNLHLGMCRHCRAYVRQVRLTREVVGHTPPADLPEHVEAELVQRFRSWRRNPAPLPPTTPGSTES
jgi:anti-sigma factor RsiW